MPEQIVLIGCVRVCSTVMIDIAPGEPVPPGLEHEVKPVAEIQKRIDRTQNETFVGLEYLAELNKGDNKEPAYVCVLCEKHGDPRTIIHHMISYLHRLKYLVIVIFHANHSLFIGRSANTFHPQTHIISFFLHSIDKTQIN